MPETNTSVPPELVAKRRVMAQLLLLPFPAVLAIIIVLTIIGSIATRASAPSAAADIARLVQAGGYFVVVPLYATLLLAPIGILLCFTRWRLIQTPFLRALAWLDITLILVFCVGLPLLAGLLTGR